MSSEEIEPGVQWAERNLTAAFHRSVLARYKCSLDLYEVEEDDCGGKLRKRTEVDEHLPDHESRYFEVRYGFRHLVDGRICIVALLPDWERLPQREQQAWATDFLGDVAFAENDSTYERWKARLLGGEWNEPGPLEDLKEQLRRVRAITSVALDAPLFESSDSPLLHYPIGENSAELLASIAELHRLVIDGLLIEPLRRLANALEVATQPNSGSLGILKAVLPAHLIPKVHTPLADLRQARNKLHQVPAPSPLSLPAFDAFLETARNIATAIGEFRAFLASTLPIDEEACVRRMEILESTMRPKVVPLHFRHADTDNLERVCGKTVERVEIGSAGGLARPIHEGGVVSVGIDEMDEAEGLGGGIRVFVLADSVQARLSSSLIASV